jgi:hypothetical protein
MPPPGHQSAMMCQKHDTIVNSKSPVCHNVPQVRHQYATPGHQSAIMCQNHDTSMPPPGHQSAMMCQKHDTSVPPAIHFSRSARRSRAAMYHLPLVMYSPVMQFQGSIPVSKSYISRFSLKFK